MMDADWLTFDATVARLESRLAALLAELREERPRAPALRSASLAWRPVAPRPMMRAAGGTGLKATPAAAGDGIDWRRLQRELRESGRYVLLPSYKIDRAPRRAAAEASAFCARHLALAAPRLWWVEPATPDALARAGAMAEHTVNAEPNLRGWFSVDEPGTIYVAATTDAGAAVKTVAHETRHAWQLHTLGPVRDQATADGYERDAAAFAAAVVAWWDAQQDGQGGEP